MRLKKACGVTYAEASGKIIKVKIEDVEIPFADLELMIRLKQSARPQDQMDLEFLKALKGRSAPH